MLSDYAQSVLKAYKINEEDVQDVSTELVVTMKDGTRQQLCEVWSRVMGYYRPMSEYNVGKRQEHEDRQLFVEEKAGCSCE